MARSGDFHRQYQFGTFVIWPPDDVRKVVGALRQRYDPASQAVCDAHITLTQPFLREPSDDDLAGIAEVTARHPAMEIHYSPLATFLPYPCVYLEIEPAEQVRVLRTDLHDLGLFNLSLPFSDPAEFIPHMSITDGYPAADQTRHIFDALRGSEPSGSFRAATIAWILPDDGFRFEVVRTFELSR